MTMKEEKRMAGEYEIIHSLHVGAREVVVGVNADRQYMCSYYTELDVFSNYTETMVSEDYLEIMTLFVGRVSGQIQAAKAERSTIHIPLTVLTKEMCLPLYEGDSIEGKVVAVKPDSLRPEYQRIDRQLILVTGGNGARGKARGSGIFGINLFTGRSAGRWERWDILGVVKPEHIPEWANDKLKIIERERELENKTGTEERKRGAKKRDEPCL